jgi:hypothetical protein
MVALQLDRPTDSVFYDDSELVEIRLQRAIDQTLSHAPDAIVRQHEIEAAKAWVADAGIEEVWKDDLWDAIHSPTPNQDDLVRLCASIRQANDMREGITGKTSNLRWNKTFRAEYGLYFALREEGTYWSFYLYELEFGKKRPFAGAGFVFPVHTPPRVEQAKRLQANKGGYI